MSRNHDFTGIAQLPLRIVPGQYETPISVFNRLAMRSGYATIPELLSHVPNLQRGGRLTLDRAPKLAARLIGCEEEALARSTVFISGSSFILEGERVNSGRSDRRGRVCIDCLKADFQCASPGQEAWSPFLRDWWQVAQIGACPTHLLPLIQTCPQCGDGFDVSRSSAAKCRCGFDILSMSVPRLAAEEVALDIYLLGRLCRGEAVEVPLLDNLSFASAAGLALAIGGALDPALPWSRSWNPGLALSQYGSQGFSSLVAGWEGFDAALSIINNNSSKAYKKSRKIIGYYGRLQHWLGIMAPAAELQPFRDRMIAH